MSYSGILVVLRDVGLFVWAGGIAQVPAGVFRGLLGMELGMGL